MVFKHARLIHLRTAHCAAVVGLSHETLVDEVDGEFLGGETRLELMNRPDVQGVGLMSVISRAMSKDVFVSVIVM